MNKIETVVVDGVEHKVTDFSDSVKQIVSIRETWAAQAEVELLTLKKTQAAIRQLDQELNLLIQSELQAKEAPEVKPKRSKKK